MRPMPRSLIRAAGPTLLAGLLIASRALALTPEHRLERTVVPTSESLRLDLDAGKPGYAGSARIALKVAAATERVRRPRVERVRTRPSLPAPSGLPFGLARTTRVGSRKPSGTARTVEAYPSRRTRGPRARLLPARAR